MIEKGFVREGIMKIRLDEFLRKSLGRANYSNVVINRTPVSTRIVIYAEKPGLVIGRGGEKINSIIEMLKRDYGIENPIVEAEEVLNPDLNAKVVAKNIAAWIEKGGHAKRVGNIYLERIITAGAIGAQIELSGKLSGERHRTEKFGSGYIKRCGQTSKDLVDYSYQVAVTKPGTIGIKVRIMREMPDYMQLMKKIKDLDKVEVKTEEKKEVRENIFEQAKAKKESRKKSEKVKEEVKVKNERKREKKEVKRKRKKKVEKEMENDIEKS